MLCQIIFLTIWKVFCMDFNVLKLYRVFALIGLILVIKQIIFLCKKPKNSTHFSLLFWVCFYPWAIETAVFLLGDMFGKPDRLNVIESQGVKIVLLLILFVQIVLTVLLYLFSGRYAEFHIVYKPKKKRKPLMVDLDESYIVLYGFLKFNKKKIYIRDISIEDSVYILQLAESKLFPYAAIFAAKDRFLIKLKNGKAFKIRNKCGVVFGPTAELIILAKTLGVRFES